MACADGHVYECRARGGFRGDGRTPLVGDDVRIALTLDSEKEYTGNVTELLPRHSELIRPRVANVDQAVIFFSILRPDPSFALLDRFLIALRRQGLPIIICFNKEDISGEKGVSTIRSIYGASGYELLFMSVLEDKGIDALRERLLGRTSVLAGPSGAGKSSLLNLLQPGAGAETGELSKKLSRGKNTTRHSELFRIASLSDTDPAGPQTYLCDTPGFTAFTLQDMEYTEVSRYYEEFAPYEPRCRFALCSHISEPDCMVKAAVERGEISRVRYDGYVGIYDELKSRRWGSR